MEAIDNNHYMHSWECQFIYRIVRSFVAQNFHEFHKKILPLCVNITAYSVIIFFAILKLSQKFSPTKISDYTV